MAAEKHFENRIKSWLTIQKAWHVKFFANAYTRAGVPDILASINGDFWGIEVKAADGKPSLLQLNELRDIDHSGGHGVLLYPKDFEEFKNYITSSYHTNWYEENKILQEKWRRKLNGN